MLRPVTIAPPSGLTAADERHHPTGPEPWWNESWYFDFATTDGTLGGYVRIGLYPNQGAAWYWACLVGEGRPLVTVVDHTVAPPAAGSLELRGEGLWADHTVEVPFDHMTLGCEAFALGLDDPAEMYGDPRGERVPFGLDLEWDTDGAAYAYPPGTTRYEVPVPGRTARSWWGTSRSPRRARRHRPARPLVGRARLVDPRAGPGPPAGSTTAPASTAPPCASATTRSRTTPGTCRRPAAPWPRWRTPAPRPTLGAHGMPVSDTVEVGDLRLAVEPVAFAPVLLADGEGRTSRFPRALCRFADPATGRRGVGWTEWNQPQALPQPG